MTVDEATLPTAGRSARRRRLAAALVILVLSAIPAREPFHAAVQPQQPTQQDEFVPIDQLPPEEQLPAAPLLVAAYTFVWVAVLVYFWSIWRRLAKVERELADVARRASGQERRP